MTRPHSAVLASIEADLAQRVKAAAADHAPLRLCGGGSQAGVLPQGPGSPLDLTVLSGIVAYEPSELVITAGAGTPLADIAAALAERGQMLPFEPRLAAGRATLGGAVAAQRGGPRRWTAGAVRDFLLGLRIIDGRGQLLSFGGQVIKNVAGFDVTRLQAGAWGSLGIITEVSVKVLPVPQVECTLQFELSQEVALREVNRWAGQPLPLSASSWHAGVLRVRLSGVPAAVEHARTLLGGERLDASDAGACWDDLREWRHPLQRRPGVLWRLAVSPVAPPLDLPGETLWEWGGGQRWLHGDLSAEQVRHAARRAGGHAQVVRGAPPGTAVFQPLEAPLDTIHRRIKAVFDPAGIFNPGIPDFL